MIVSSTNKNFGYILEERLRRNFNNRLHTITVCDLYEIEELDLRRYDCIYSTIHAQEFEAMHVQIPVFNISTIFSEEEKDSILFFLTDINSMMEKMKGIFREELFFTNISARNKEEVFSYVYETLEEKLHVPYQFYEDIIRKEQLLSSEVANSCARIKTLQRYTDESFAAVYILEKPILWRYKNVQLIIIWNMGIKDTSNHKFYEHGVISHLIERLFGGTNEFAKILKCHSYDHFVQMLEKDIITVVRNAKLL